MITYKDLYEVAENNPLVFFDFPQSTERWHLFIASDGYYDAASGGLK